MKLNKTITLISISTDRPKSTLDIMQLCCKKFPFFDKKILLSNYDDKFNDIEVKKVPVNSYEDFNRFKIENLNEYIDTDFALIVEDDGYITNQDAWTDDFLNYDYIGAPWPWHGVCGNGGFSLRSKKFLEISSTLIYDKSHDEYPVCPEDSFLCLDRYKRKYLIEKGIKFADIFTALKFSFEHPIQFFPSWNKNMSFGFHGKFNK